MTHFKSKSEEWMEWLKEEFKKNEGAHPYRLKYLRDLKNAMDTAYEEGYKKGFEIGLRRGRKKIQLEIARRLKEGGIEIVKIAACTGLSEEEVESL